MKPMKASCFLFFFLITVCFNTVTSQVLKNEELPPGLVYEFKNRYPGVEKVEWTYRNGYYYADFQFGGNSVIAQYEKNTKWLKAETNIKPELLPKHIAKYISTQFPDQKIQDVKYIEKIGESAFYRIQTVEFNETRILFFDNDGVFQRMTDHLGNDIITGQITNEPGTQPISIKELPSGVNSYVANNYPHFRISNSYLVNNNEFENAYYVILTSNLAKDKVHLWFDFKGTLLKKNDPNQPVVNDPTASAGKQAKKKGTEKPNSISEDQVPAPVKSSFNKQVKKHEKLSWSIVKGNYVATYFEPIRKENCRAEFSPTGQWIQTFTELNPKNLNPNIVKHINDNYPTLKIHSAESVNTASRKRFVLVKLYSPRWQNDPMVYHELYFAQSGRLEKEIYADYIDNTGDYLNENRQKDTEQFLEYVDKDDFSGNDDYKKISSKELPTKVLNHIKSKYPYYRITESYILTDEDSGELVYWVVLRKEGVKGRIKAVYNFKGNFISEEEF